VDITRSHTTSHFPWICSSVNKVCGVCLTTGVATIGRGSQQSSDATVIITSPADDVVVFTPRARRHDNVCCLTKKSPKKWKFRIEVAAAPIAVACSVLRKFNFQFTPSLGRICDTLTFAGNILRLWVAERGTYEVIPAKVKCIIAKCDYEYVSCAFY